MANDYPGVEAHFTKGQQDMYFREGLCPHCGSDDLLYAGWESRECFRTGVREVWCDGCEEEWFEVRLRDMGVSHLLTPVEVVDYFDDDSEEDEADPDDEDDVENGDIDGEGGEGEREGS